MGPGEQSVVVVVDDDAGVRESLQLLLGAVGLQAAGYGSAREFLDGQDLDRVGCLVLDVRLPGMSGLDLLDLLRGRSQDLPAVVVSGYADVPMAVRAIKAGALDFLEKPFNQQRLLDLVQQALRDSEGRRRLLGRRAEFAARLGTLTQREREVLGLIVSGRRNKAIAVEVGISPKTLDIHRGNVLRKMGVGGSGALAALVWRDAPDLALRATADAAAGPRQTPAGPSGEKSKAKRGRPKKAGG